MKTIRYFAAISLIASVMVSGSTPAGAKRGLPVLRGTTVITGDEPGSMRVRLPAPVTTDGLMDWDLASITGRGRLIYFLLAKERRDGSLNHKIFIEGYRENDCSVPACRPQDDGWGGGSGGKGDDETLPAGVYRLYLVTDGAPARIELELRDLSGRTAVTPTEPVEVEIETLTPTVANVSSPAYVAYSEAPFEGKGVAFLALWVEGPTIGPVTYGHCAYMRSSPDLLTSYLPPNCPQDATLTPENSSPGDHYGVNHLWTGFPNSIGTWYAGESVKSGSVVMWLKTL